MKYLSLGLRGLLTVAFFAAGGAKLAGVDMMVQTFDALGFGQWFRYVTAIIEITGAVLLWLPNRQAAGAALLGGTMVAAVLSHIFLIGPTAVPAIILGLLSAVVLYIYRSQVPAILGRA